MAPPRTATPKSTRARTSQRNGDSASATSSKGATGRSAQTNDGQQQLTCPECGRTFTRAAALGAHRRHAHGVVGASASSKAKAPTSSSQAGTRRATRAAATPRAARKRSAAGTAAQRSRSTSNGSQRDQLLATIFPSGIPAREDVIRAVNAWLDEAERLAELR